ncbi:MAG: UDP-3-O-(3-hydroxymyristoyl)glucosamine N-acyltransferase [Planctomycetota bacterium]|nr:UDP-3-O-(3-hydroxymyristoyl)glucosamine N-acyltransferase [Planctomycetota bacterium]
MTAPSEASSGASVGLGFGLGTAAQVAAKLGAEVLGDSSVALTRVGTVEGAAPGELTFLRGREFANQWGASKASAAIVTRGIEIPGGPGPGRALIVVDDADLALSKVLAALKKPEWGPGAGVHPSAIIDPTAKLGAGVAVGPFVVVGPGAQIGDGVSIGAHSWIGARASVGAGTRLHPRVTILDDCVVGRACILWPGVVIGADGFGYRPGAPRPDDPLKRPTGIEKIPHTGNVVIGDLVEIGANSCVDRAKFGSTIIGSMTKIDNVVQIGHGCVVGRGCLICAGVGMAGSVELGDGVTLAGMVGVADGISIAAGSTVGAQSGVISDLPEKGQYLGTPALPLHQTRKVWASWLALAEMRREIKVLIKRFLPADGGA